MDKPMPGIFFKFMSIMLSIRNRFKPPVEKLKSVGIEPGDYVLDYGCGPGDYSIDAATIVGEKGKVYALDIQPLAGERVMRVAERKGLTNLETICSDCATGLDAVSLDVIILYDIIHMLSESEKVLNELHRVLKPDGTLSVDCHHWKGDRIREEVLNTGLFEFKNGENGTFNFAKVVDK